LRGKEVGRTQVKAKEIPEVGTGGRIRTMNQMGGRGGQASMA